MSATILHPSETPAVQPQERRDRWWLAVALASALVLLLAGSLGFLFLDGTAIWGNNIPVTWSLDIVSYDWWIGAGCGALFIAGAGLLLRAEWLSPIMRLAETTAVLCAASAAVYPIIHLGRPWFFFWNLPYPNSFALWPQFRSPLFWDAMDILAFLFIAAAFWGVGMLPDLAALRDRAIDSARSHARGLLQAQLYGLAALGWRGSVVHWHRWLHARRALATLGMITVVVLQIGASVMFAGTLEPGWHDTMLPITALAGALLSGAAMLSLLTIILRDAFRLQALITARHLRALSMLILCLALAGIYCEASSDFAILAGDDAYAAAFLRRHFVGPVAWSTWMFLAGGLAAPLLFLVPSARARPAVLAAVSGCVLAGMWGEHYALIVGSLQHDFLPSAAHASHITFFEWSTFAGSAGLFLLLLLIFLRLCPIVATRAQPAVHAAAAAQAEPGRDAPLWGVAGEFSSEADMVHAITLLDPHMHGRIDAYSPIPSEPASRALALRSRSLTAIAALAGAAGAAAMFAMCTYATEFDYVFDIGNRPRFSWPAFIVPSASFGCLCAAAAALSALLVLSRLPRLNHPAFNIPGVTRASRDRFFVVAHGHEDAYGPEAAAEAFAAAGPLAVHRVPR